MIVKFGEEIVNTPQGLQLAVERSAIGSEVTLEVVRDAKSMQLTYVAQQQPGDFETKARGKQQSAEPKSMNQLGLEIASLSSEVARQLGVEATEGVVITSVASGSPAAEAGLSPGMVIVEANRTKVNSPEEFAQALAAAGEDSDSVLLLVRSERGSQFVVIRIG